MAISNKTDVNVIQNHRLAHRSVKTHTNTVIPAKEGVAKSIKALNHRGTKATKEKLFFVLFVVPFFSGPFATPSFVGMTVVVCGVGMGFNASVH